MNENMNGQVPNINPQPTVTPVAPVAPTAPVAPMAPQVPVQPNVAMPQAPVTPKKPMDKADIMKWVGVGAGAFITIAPLLNYVGAYGLEYSLWDNNKFASVIFMLFGVLAALTFFFGKAKRFSLLATGASFWYSMSIFETNDFGFDYLKMGFWLMLLGGIVLLVLNVMENLDELKSLIPQKSATPNASPVVPAMVPPVPQATFVPAQPQPVQPVAPIVEPVAQATVVCTNCGQPKKNPMDQFCQSCGQRY